MRSLIGLSLLLLAASAAAQTAAPPEVVGPLVGPGASPAQPSLRLYGTDLGWTFEHQGRLVMLFGDTWPAAGSLCEGEPRNDDTVATLPLEPPGGVPPLTFVTRPEAPEPYLQSTRPDGQPVEKNVNEGIRISALALRLGQLLESAPSAVRDLLEPALHPPERRPLPVPEAPPRQEARPGPVDRQPPRGRQAVRR